VQIYIARLQKFSGALELCPKLHTEKISQRQVDRVFDRVVNKTRRRSSLLMTVATIDALSVIIIIIIIFMQRLTRRVSVIRMTNRRLSCWIVDVA